MPAIYVRQSNTVYVAARELCVFLCRGGDIDTRYGAKRGVIGGNIVPHAPRGEMPDLDGAYFQTYAGDGFDLVIYTRPDAIGTENGETVVTETFTIPSDPQYLGKEDLNLGSTSAATCAALFLTSTGTERCVARAIYCRAKTGETRIYTCGIGKADGEEHLRELSSRFMPYAAMIARRGGEGADQLRSMRFPFKGQRGGQRDFITETYRTVASGGRLVVQSPTGTGKTIASLYPSLKAIGEGYADRVFYLTAKAITGVPAQKTMELIAEKAPYVHTSVITAREKACPICPAGTSGSRLRKLCNPLDCPYAKGYYERAGAAVLELLTGESVASPERIREVAVRERVCPYELSLDISEWCDVVICDYNYLFDLHVYLRRYFDAPDARYVFLADEAHNLPDRAREMLSATLERSAFQVFESAFGNEGTFAEAYGEAMSIFDRMYMSCLPEMKHTPDGGEFCFDFHDSVREEDLDTLARFAKECDRVCARIGDDELYELSRNVKHFVTVATMFDRGYVYYTEVLGGDVRLRILCLDPGRHLNERMKLGKASVLFSATLTPLSYFTDILGCSHAETMELPSPYDPENLCLVAVDGISTRFEDRDANAAKVASVIYTTVTGKRGNYLVYFPSYRYLESVVKIFLAKYPEIHTIVQRRSMSEAAKRDFLDAFEKKNGMGETFVGFCVLGGSFSEGIDLRGERLIGTVIVGVGMPSISTEGNIMRDYFQETREDGFAYAYTYPGMNKVMQAVGRVIRGEEDRGIAVLIDDRFGTPVYTHLMPCHWRHIRFTADAKSLASIVSRFWQDK